MTLAMTDFKTLEAFSDRIALHAERDYSYSDMIGIADTIADAVGKRTLVFILCANNKESVFGYVGFLRSRIVPVLLDAAIRHDQLEKLIDLYQPAFVWAHSSHPFLSESMESTFTHAHYTLFRHPTPADHALNAELALLVTTSGSTGSPKFVRLSSNNLFSNAESIAEYLHITSDDRPITTLPMHYSYGLSILNSHLIRGATIILTDASIVTKDFWQLCKEQRATTFGGVPFVYEMLDKLKFDKMELPHLRTLTQAGGKMKPELACKFAEICQSKGIEFISMYGQTETTARMSYLPHEKQFDKPGSIGRAIPGGELTLQDEEGNEISDPHINGELIYRGPNVSLGYAESIEDLASGDDNHGMLRTGDIAYRDEDGDFFITGRLKRIIKLYGTRISLDEIERLLYDHGHDCVCTGNDDELIIYTVKDDTDAIQKTMKEHLHVKGFTIRKRDELPRNAYGKILYSELR
ncbi:AMP-binding protein [Jeotgalibacillus aurantiacus]|uniref:AMP-binding protein n=1 Tax=Jeotgalibacillus aurantiacus TaxID=2763266 RepID=UPI001D09B564|nr:AMP-binding protein [Jeotgalibacillus aurantiacus]